MSLILDYDKSPEGEEEEDDDCFHLGGRQNPKIVLSPLSKIRQSQSNTFENCKELDYVGYFDKGKDDKGDTSSVDNSSSILQQFFQMSFFTTALPDNAETTSKVPAMERHKIINSTKTHGNEVKLSTDAYGAEKSFEFADVYGKRRPNQLSKIEDFDGELIGAVDPKPSPCDDCGALPVWIIRYDRWSITDRRCDACNLNADERSLQAQQGHSLEYVDDGEDIIFDHAEYKGNMWDKQSTHSWFVSQSRSNGTEEQYADSVLFDKDQEHSVLNTEIDSIEIADIYKSNGEDISIPAFSSSRAMFNQVGGVRSRAEWLGISASILGANGPILDLDSNTTTHRENRRSNNRGIELQIRGNTDHQSIEDHEDCQSDTTAETAPLIASKNNGWLLSSSRDTYHRVPLEIAASTTRLCNAEDGETYIVEDSAEDYYSQPFFCYLLCGLFS